MTKDVLKQLEKKYGIIIGHLGTDEARRVASIPTGLLPLDYALGIGGVPKGLFTEIFAPEGVGKTTLSLQIIAEAQRLGIQAAYIDMEHRLDPSWAEKLGVDLSEMYFTQPPYGEAALNVARELVREGVGVVVIDSVPSLVPKVEWEGETGDQFVGLLPRMLAQGLRQMTHDMKKNESSVIFINQIRAKIGGMSSFAGPKQTTPGGWALKHNASVRISMRYAGAIYGTGKDSDKHVAQRVLATVRKNSVGTPLRDADLILRYGVGFDAIDSVIDLGIKYGLVEQAHAWYTINGEKLQGRQNLYDYMKENEDVRYRMESELRGILFGEQDNSSVEYTE